jgi:hypothetical protein
MLSRSFLLVAVASIAVLAVSAEDCTTKTLEFPAYDQLQI